MIHTGDVRKCIRVHHFQQKFYFGGQWGSRASQTPLPLSRGHPICSICPSSYFNSPPILSRVYATLNIIRNQCSFHSPSVWGLMTDCRTHYGKEGVYWRRELICSPSWKRIWSILVLAFKRFLEKWNSCYNYHAVIQNGRPTCVFSWLQFRHTVVNISKLYLRFLGFLPGVKFLLKMPGIYTA